MHTVFFANFPMSLLRLDELPELAASSRSARSASSTVARRRSHLAGQMTDRATQATHDRMTCHSCAPCADTACLNAPLHHNGRNGSRVTRAHGRATRQGRHVE